MTNIIPLYEKWFATGRKEVALSTTWSPCKEWKRDFVIAPGTDGTALFLISETRKFEWGPHSNIEVAGWLFIHPERLTVHVVRCCMSYSFQEAADLPPARSSFAQGGLRALRKPRPSYSPAEMLNTFTKEVFGPGWRISVGFNERKVKSLKKSVRRRCQGLSAISPALFEHVLRRSLPTWARSWCIAQDLPCGEDEVTFLRRFLNPADAEPELRGGAPVQGGESNIRLPAASLDQQQ